MLNWQKVKLCDLLIPRTDRFKPNDIAISGLKRIEKIDFSGNIILSDKISNTDMILIKNGDLVISGINVSKGAMSIYQGLDDILATIHYSSYKFNKDRIDIDFLKFYLKSSVFKKNLQEQVQGGIKTELKPKHILSLIVEIPKTLYEQKEVVRLLKIKCNQIENLFYEQSYQFKILDKIRQQILYDAFTGKLTAEWRENNQNFESSTQLLKRIIDRKKISLYSKKDKILSTFSEKEIPFELPKGWIWCRLGNIISFGPTNGYSPKESKKGNGIKCLTLTATTSGFFKDGYFKYVDEAIPFDSNLWLKKNDILLQRGNSIDYVGIAALYEGENNKYIYPDLMIKIQVADFISPKFVHQVLNSPFNRIYFTSKATGTQRTMPKINQNVVLNTLIPFPPLEEQNILINKIEVLLDKLNQIKTEIEAQSKHGKDLLRVLFNETFSDKYKL